MFYKNSKKKKGGTPSKCKEIKDEKKQAKADYKRAETKALLDGTITSKNEADYLRKILNEKTMEYNRCIKKSPNKIYTQRIGSPSKKSISPPKLLLPKRQKAHLSNVNAVGGKSLHSKKKKSKRKN